MKICIYDMIALKNGESLEIIQVYNENSFLATPLKGGMPRKITLDEISGVTASLFGEADSDLSKFQALVSAAESRWNEHSSVVGKGRAPAKRGGKEAPILNIDLDF
jgi:hypothetical protein